MRLPRNKKNRQIIKLVGPIDWKLFLNFDYASEWMQQESEHGGKRTKT